MNETKSTKTLLVAAITVAMATWLVAPTALAESGRITETMGQVERGRGMPLEFEPVAPGDAVMPGDVIRTGRGGRVELVLGAGTARLYENSLLRVPADPKSRHQMELEQGRSIFDVLKQSVKDRFEVRTPEVVVSVKGTRFEVDLVGRLAEVAVFHGTVGVRAPDAALELETLVREGFAATGKADVPFELDVRPRTDPWESWATIQEAQKTAMDEMKHDRSTRMRIAAQASARKSSAKELVGLATKRNPEVARRVAEMRKERREAAKAAALESGDAPGRGMPAAMDEGAGPSGGSTKMSQLDPVQFARKGKPGIGRGPAAARGSGKMDMDLEARELVKHVESDRKGKKKIKHMMLQSMVTEQMELEDPTGGGSSAGGWDPTPNLSVLEVAELGLPLSYQDIMTVWYTALDEIYQYDPTIFEQPDPGQYETELLIKLDELGLPPGIAGQIVDYIISQIEL